MSGLSLLFALLRFQWQPSSLANWGSSELSRRVRRHLVKMVTIGALLIANLHQVASFCLNPPAVESHYLTVLDSEVVHLGSCSLRFCADRLLGT